MEINFSKIESFTWAVMLFMLISIIGSGTLMIFTCSPDFFIHLDTFKLILLSVAITAPYWLINTSIVTTYEFLPFDDVESRIKTWALAGSVFSFPVLYLPIGLKFFFGNISIGIVVLFSIIIEIATIIFLKVSIKKEKKAKIFK